MRQGRKNLLVSFLIVATVFGASAVVLHHPTFHWYLLHLTERATGLKIAVADSKVRLLTGKVLLQGLEVHDPQGRFQVTVERMALDLSPLSPLRGKVIVTDLEIDRPSVRWERGPRETRLDHELFRKIISHLEGSWFLQNMILEKIVIRDLSLAPPAGASNAVPLLLKEVHLRIEPTLLRQLAVEAEIGEASGLLPSLKSLAFEAILKRDGIKLKNLRLESEKVGLSLQGEWKGDLEKGSIDLEGEFTAPRVLSDPLRFDLKGELRQRVVRIARLGVKLGPATFEADGEFHLEPKSYRLAFSAKDLPLEAIFQKLKSPVLGPAKGIGEVRGIASGTLPRLQATADAKILNFRHGALSALESTGKLSLHWPELDFEADSRPSAGSAIQSQVKGGVIFKHVPGREKLQAVLKTLEARFTEASLPAFLPSWKVGGRLDGKLNLEGAAGTSVQGTAKATVTDGRLPFGPVEVLESEVTFRPGGKITFHKSRFRLPSLSLIEWPGPIELDTSGEVLSFKGEPAPGLTFKGGSVKGSGPFRIDSLQVRKDGASLDGSLSLSAGGRGDARMKGTFNLEWLRELPTLFRDGRGLAHVDLTATGTIQEPTLRGTIRLSKNDLEIRGIPQPLSEMTGELRIDGGTLRPNLSGLLGEGEFHLGGSMGLARLQPTTFDLRVQGENLTFHRPGVYKIDFNADLTLRGSTPTPRLEGQIDIVDGRYLRTFVVREMILKPSEGPEEPSPWEERLAPLPLRLTVRNSGDLRVKNNIADILLRSDLRIEGTYGSPRIQGAFMASEGVFHLLGEDFTLSEGRLEFINPARAEPYLTLVAEREIPPNHVVFIEVKGYLSNLGLTFSSTPSLPREDILSLIAFGLTRAEIRESGRPRRSLSADVLAGEVTSLLERPLARTTGVDIFRLEASEAGTPSRLSVGKRLTERLHVEYTTDFAPETAERTVQANYYLTDNVLLKGFRTQTAGTVPHYQFNISFRFRLH